MKKVYSYFLPCPRGLEELLAQELQEIAQLTPTLRIHNTSLGGVHCSGLMTDAYYLNLYSRIASRVLLRMSSRRYDNENDIYDLTLEQPWEDWFSFDETIRVDVTAIKSPLKSLEFATLKIKDAVCDRFRDQFKKRPSVDTRNPHVRIQGFLDANNYTVYIDTSGEALFKRGWRIEKGDAPLRENLAAALLRASGWKAGMPLMDPMCGSGTLIVEAAQILAGIPPGYHRRFGFESLKNFDAQAWQHIKAEVKVRADILNPQIWGSDISGDMIVMARHNLQKAGIPFEVPLKQIDAQEIQSPLESRNEAESDTSLPAQPKGIIITNPPYGERIGVRGNQTFTPDELARSFFAAFSATLKQRFSGWRVFLFTADLSLPKLLRLKESRKTPFYNGALECRLFRFDMVAGFNRRHTESNTTTHDNHD